jgi:quercetin dioxygenase-like cupin family protein
MAEPGLGTHADDRGLIQDLLGGVDGVTEIFTLAGAVRGNHVHLRTTQWTYVVRGVLTVAAASEAGDGTRVFEAAAGEFFEEAAGIPHAWKAVTDCVVLVFTRGPRSGEAYESDTRRLPENARLLT